MLIAVGSTNEAKRSAVIEAVLNSPHFFDAEVKSFLVDSEVALQPLSLEETIKGAKNRAKNAFHQCKCEYGFGIESGFMQAPETSSGYLHISACAIYDGENNYIGLSSGFEVPLDILELIFEHKMDLHQACLYSGIDKKADIGFKGGLIGVLTQGKINRKEYDKQSVVAAILQLENKELYFPSLQANTSIKAVIFDCDGTLVDSEKFHFFAWQDALKKKGHSFSKECYINHFSGLSDVEICKVAPELLGFPFSEKLLEEKNRIFCDFQKRGIEKMAATVEFAKRLFLSKKKSDLKIAVASAARKEEILENLRSIQIEHYFDVILSGRDDLSDYHDLEGTNKPKPYVYLKTAKLLGLKPEECVAIEDSRAGVTAAVDAGCITVAIPNEFTQYHDLSHAHLKLTTLDGINLNAFFKMVEPLEALVVCK